MQAVSIDRSDSIIAWLADHQTQTFSRLLYNVPILYAAVQNPNLSMILAPTDSALQRLSEQTNKPLAQLQFDAYGIDILSNHLSIVPTQKVWPMFIAINQNKYGSGPQDLIALKVQATTIIDGVVILIIDAILLFDDQLAKAALKRDLGVMAPLGQLDLLMVLIERGQIRGKDLIALCVSDPELNKLCDVKVDFDRLLQRDYQVKVPENKSAREYYVELAMGYRAWTSLYLDQRGQQARAKSRDALEGISPVMTNRGFIQIAAGEGFTALLNDEGDVFVLGTLTVGNFDDEVQVLVNAKLEPVRISEGLKRRIVKLRAGDFQIVMLDDQGQLWLYGELGEIKIYNRYYVENPEVPRSSNILRDALLEEDFEVLRFFDTPQLIQRKYPKAKIYDFNLNIMHKQLVLDGDTTSLIVIIENVMPANYGLLDSPSIMIKSIFKSGLRISLLLDTKESVLLVPLDTNSLPVSLDNVLRLHNMSIMPQSIIKVDSLILTDEGFIWRIIPEAGAGISEQVLYELEPDLRFVDIIDDHFGSVWVLSEDGRLFTNNSSRMMRRGRNHELIQYLLPNRVMEMSFFPGPLVNAALLTQMVRVNRVQARSV